MAANQVLDRLVEPAMETARRLSQASGKTEHVYGEFQYKTEKTWPHQRRIIYKAEVVRHPDRCLIFRKNRVSHRSNDLESVFPLNEIFAWSHVVRGGRKKTTNQSRTQFSRIM
jgi:hypothetical protein